MGFYGNITNTSRTQFQFDRTFPNRAVMDNLIGTDGVYIGRFVLVEYDKDLAADWCTVAYQKTENGVKHFYTGADLSYESELLYTVGNIQTGKYIRVPGSFYDTDGTYISYNKDNPEITFDIIYEILASDKNMPPKVQDITTKKPMENDYIVNYNIDRAKYGGGRGYDSTVWQKVYADGAERYVMIAELNSVVPTFGVSADAPTMSPVAPHFDADSTNMFYRVHWQPGWGLRIKSAAPSISVKPIDDTGKTVSGADIILSSTTQKSLPTDENTYWLRSSYDASSGEQKNYYYMPSINKETLKTTGEWKTYNGVVGENMKFPAAIYYNKAGFDPAFISYSDESVKDQITIEPTGLSGYRYNDHKGTGSTEPQIDTQELSIMLPSIGNSVAQMWDLIYGDEEVNGSNQRNTYITWSAGSVVPNVSGLRLVTKTEDGYGYEPRKVETLAGAINSVHDLMGMIIQKKDMSLADVTSSMAKAWGPDYIYYLSDEGRYYRAHKTYKYNEAITTSFTKDDRYVDIESYVEWPEDGYYYLDRAATNPVPAGGGDPYPNIIKGKTYEEGRTYYTTVTPGTPVGEFKGGSFTPYKFFVYNRNVEAINELGEKVTINAYQTSLDKEFNSASSYVSITHDELPEDTRFWSSEETYYTATFSEVANPTDKMLSNYELFIEDENGKYKRAEPSKGLNLELTYYTPGDFKPAKTLNSNLQHFMVKTKVEGDTYYIETPIYEEAKGVTSANFKDKEYYTKAANGQYAKAESFVSGTTYYTKEIILTPQQGQIVIKPEYITEVFLRDINSTAEINGKVGIYCQYRPKSYNGHDEYFQLTAANCKGFTSSLVVAYVTTNLQIYEPNLYYYLVENKQNPLYGSYVFDSSSEPTKGRKYWSADSVKYSGQVNVGTAPVYEPYKYYYKVGNDYVLSASKVRDTQKTYYEKKGLYVKSDTSGAYPMGMEWNLNITTVPTGITLSGRTEAWELQELEGFARHYTTIHGLILRISSLLEQKDDLIRDYNTVQGLINKLRDFFVQMGELRGNQILVTDDRGRITTTTMIDDNWIKTTYPSSGKIKIEHQYIGEESGKGTHTVNGETADKTLTFGGTFTSPSFSFTTDNMGHTNSFSTSSKTITMPTLEFTEDTSGNVVTNMTMSAGSGSNKVTFTETRENVGTLALASYTTPTENVTGITSTDTINGAFTKINTLLAGYDATITANANEYITEVTQTNGKLAAKTAKTTSITKLGTITEGTWNATQLATAYIADAAITTDKIANTAVTSVKIASSSIAEGHIVDGAVTNAKIASGISAAKLTTGTLPIARIADGAITAAKIADGTITGTQIALDTITAKHMTTNSVVTAKIADSAITTDKIDNLAVTSAKIAGGSIAEGHIADGAVTNAKIASGISATKITTGTMSSERVVLTGYTAYTDTNTALSATDTLLLTIRKLEARIKKLEESLMAGI